MPLEKCPTCNKPISIDAATCPKCGHNLQAGWVEAQKKKSERAAGVSAIVFLAVVGLAVYGWLFGGDRDASGRRCGDKISAYLMSETFMKRHLKAPASASFPSHDAASITRIDCGKWRVASYVDAHNSFGALVRTRFSVLLSYDGDRTWSMESINMDR